MKVIYISSPYTIGDSAAHVTTQLQAAHHILDMGHCPVAPLLTHFLHIYRPRPYEDWMQMDLAIVPRVDALIRLPGESKGADREVQKARECGIPVFTDWASLAAALINEEVFEKRLAYARAGTTLTPGETFEKWLGIKSIP